MQVFIPPVLIFIVLALLHHGRLHKRYAKIRDEIDREGGGILRCINSVDSEL
jgi:hypothetical protein